MSMTPEEKKARRAERQRRHYEANKEKRAEYFRRHYEANKEKVAENGRQYREANKEKRAEQKRRYNEANKEKVAEYDRRLKRRKAFAEEDGSSFAAWIANLNGPTKTFETIANLTPDEGQTLAELIHDLSGYDMAVCELIANPPIEAEPEALTPEPTADLF